MPIGSGKTLIHKDKYKKVNWKSYTIATRTLLLATFPRRLVIKFYNSILFITETTKIYWFSYFCAVEISLLYTFLNYFYFSRILATHSLTGKRSPAFQNKPAKMCLDPKIVSDVIMEITSRFRVKENLVRWVTFSLYFFKDWYDTIVFFNHYFFLRLNHR